MGLYLMDKPGAQNKNQGDEFFGKMTFKGFEDDYRGYDDEEKDKRQIFTVDNTPPQKKHIPKVACFFGRRGDGKTLGMSAVAAWTQTRNRKLGVDYGILANFDLTFADRAYQHIIDEIKEFPVWLDDKKYWLLLIDEIAELLPAARGMSSNNLEIGAFLKQIRKRGVSVMCATQFPTEVGWNLLRQVDFFIRCKSRREGRTIDTFWWDWPGNVTGDWSRKYFPPEPDTQDWHFRIHNTDRMWGTYRTEEVIAPSFTDAQLKEEMRARAMQNYRGAGNMGGADLMLPEEPSPLGTSPDEVVDADDFAPVAAKSIRTPSLGMTFSVRGLPPYIAEAVNELVPNFGINLPLEVLTQQVTQMQGFLVPANDIKSMVIRSGRRVGPPPDHVIDFEE